MTKSKSAKRQQMLAEFTLNYGKDACKLQNWQNLCCDVGVESGTSITRCKKHLKAVNVNILDLIQAKQRNEIPYHFASQNQLRTYIKTTPGKRFPLKLAKANGLLTALLVELL